MRRLAGVAALAGLALAGAQACTNNYGRFDYNGGAQGGGGGSAGAQGGSAGAQGGSAGAQGGSAGAQGGSGGGTACAAGQMRCGGSCVPTNSLHNCGGCNNDCSQLGLVCLNGACGCSQNNQCGQGGFGISCRTSGVCDCGGQRCAPGETCRQQGGNQRCSCGGGNTRCQFGQTCCQTPAGCFNLRTDSKNCGACNHACPAGHNCVNGTCN